MQQWGRVLPGSDVDNSISVLVALVCPGADDCRQLIVRILKRLQKEPFAVSACTSLLWRFWCVSHTRITATFRTVAPLAERAAPIGDKADATIAVWI